MKLKTIAGIVDSIWLKSTKEMPINDMDIDQLCQKVQMQTRLPLEHAGDYHWIIFLPRRHEPEIGVLNRYYGLKTDGSFKVRGIEVRQSSSPPFIKKCQRDILNA